MRPNFSCKISLSNFFLLLIAILIAYSLPLNATIRYVSKTGLSIPPYITWETAADSIQECINVSVFGDTIYVANGVYIEKVTMIHGLTLIGAGMDSCIVDTRTIATPTNFYAVTMKDECSIEGFYIIVRNNQDGTIGIFSQPSLNDSLYFQGNIENNKISKSGRGIFTDNTFLTIKNNVCEDVRRGIEVGALDTSVIDSIYNNYLLQIVGKGIGTDLACRAIIHNNFIQMISNINTGIGIASAGASKIFNNLVISVNSEFGITLNVLPSEIYNNVVFDNFYEGIRFVGPNILKNNLVIGANRGYRLSSGSSDNVFYNNAWDNIINYYGFTPNSTNLTIDPMVVSEDSLDFHLQMYSPLIDAGDPSILDIDLTRSDIGLYGGPHGESYIYVDLPPRSPVNLTATVDSLIKLNWNTNTEADFNYYNVYRDTTFDFTVDSTKLIATVTDTFYYQTLPSNVETLYYKLTAMDNQENESNPSEQVSVKLVSVKNEWVPVNNYILYQNYPNPFNPSTKIGYKLKEGGYVKLYVYDIKGELVSVLVNEVQEAGYYEVEFFAGDRSQKSEVSDHSGLSGISGLASGVYIYQIFVKSENNIPVFSDIKKMVYIK